MNFDFAAHLSQAISSHRRRTGTRAASHRFAAASLPNPNLQLVPARNLHELHVRPFRKRLMIFDDLTHVLDWELVSVVHEDYTVWVSHGEAGDLVVFFVH